MLGINKRSKTVLKDNSRKTSSKEANVNSFKTNKTAEKDKTKIYHSITRSTNISLSTLPKLKTEENKKIKNKSKSVSSFANHEKYENLAGTSGIKTNKSFPIKNSGNVNIYKEKRSKTQVEQNESNTLQTKPTKSNLNKLSSGTLDKHKGVDNMNVIAGKEEKSILNRNIDYRMKKKENIKIRKVKTLENINKTAEETFEKGKKELNDHTKLILTYLANASNENVMQNKILSRLTLKCSQETYTLPGNPSVKFSKENFVRLTKSNDNLENLKKSKKPVFLIPSANAVVALDDEYFESNYSIKIKDNKLLDKTDDDTFIYNIRNHIIDKSLYNKGKGRIILSPSLSTIKEE